MADRPRQKRRVFVVGIGQTKFTKPGGDRDYPELVHEAVTTALTDAKLSYNEVQAAAVGYLYGASCCGQKCLYEVGMTGIPIINCNNACASGSTAMFTMKRFIESGDYDCVLAVGFEKMMKGSLEAMGQLTDRANPIENYLEVMSETYGLSAAPITPQMFGMAGQEHMDKYGSTVDHIAKIAWKNHKHAANNPDAQNRTEYTLDQVKNSRKIWEYLTLLECSPTSDGSAAVVLCSEDYLRRHPHLAGQAVEILGMELGTDFPSTFNENSNIKNVGFEVIQKASQRLYSATGVTPNDVQVIECHDCFAPNELITYEALGLCPIGKAGDLIDRGDNTYGGRWVVNPSGGLISKGHPIGATGVSQCIELCKHLRGIAGARQVPNCNLALQHNIGIGSAGVVALYKLAQPQYPGANQVSPSVASQLKTAETSGATFKSDQIFAEIQRRVFGPEGELAKKLKASFQFVITGPGGQQRKWLLDSKQQPPFIGQKEGQADCTVTCTDDVFVALAEKKMKPEQAFMQGKIKFKGNMAAAMKVRQIIDSTSLGLQAKL